MPSHHDLRARLFELFKEPVFQFRYGISVQEERQLLNVRWKRLHDTGVFKGVLVGGDIEKYGVIIECVGLLDHSLEVGLGVHYGLFGSTIRALGTEEQYKEWLPKIESLEARGCFALTELGHGSNARSIETIAEYDREKEVFVLNTPTETAQKYWIGGALNTAQFSTVFAQLIIDEKNYGVHPFITRLRNDDWSVAEGVQLADCGHKAGLNGVDNGRIWFTNVKVRRRNLLSKMSQVSSGGKYTSSFSSADARFGAQLAALTGGRVMIASGALTQAQLGLTIAVRYALSRRAFSPAPNRPEVTLMTYKSHQYRLLIPLSTCCVYTICARALLKSWHKSVLQNRPVSKDLHVKSSGFKALFSWWMMEALQECREACGGQGYKSENRIALLRSEHDIQCTFEGDNYVLMMQVAKAIITKRFSRSKIAEGVVTPDIESPNFEKEVFAEQDRLLSGQLVNGVKLGSARGCPAFDVWNDLQPLAFDTGKAHMRCIIYRMYEEQLKEVSQESRSTLELCGRIWGLSEIDRDPIVARLGILSAADLVKAHEQLNGLVEKLAPNAELLVDAFGLPDHLLAPIAGNWVTHNARKAKL